MFFNVAFFVLDYRHGFEALSVSRSNNIANISNLNNPTNRTNLS